LPKVPRCQCVPIQGAVTPMAPWHLRKNCSNPTTSIKIEERFWAII